MFGTFPYIPIALGILFVISMIIVIFYSCRQQRRWNNFRDTIVQEGYMKLHLRMESGRGEIFVESVDELPPLYSSEVWVPIWCLYHKKEMGRQPYI